MVERQRPAATTTPAAMAAMVLARARCMMSPLSEDAKYTMLRTLRCMMRNWIRLTAAAGAGAASLAIGAAALHAQIANNPYKVNYNWDKLEGRKIGVASGIRPDPDGTHLWILDRCGAN